MSLFPTYIETDNEVESEAENKDIPREYEVDFETGQLTGRIVEGLEAIKVWIWNVLHIPRYRFMIYSWDYGNELEELIGIGYSEEYIETEAKRMVEECLLVNEYINSISDFSIAIKNEKVNMSFIAETIYGDITIQGE